MLALLNDGNCNVFSILSIIFNSQSFNLSSLACSSLDKSNNLFDFWHFSNSNIKNGSWYGLYWNKSSLSIFLNLLDGDNINCFWSLVIESNTLDWWFFWDVCYGILDDLAVWDGLGGGRLVFYKLGLELY